ncbi:MAG: AsnC family transcriptional regulator [Microbacterium sp.]|jgi:DNA-binding Lrp family transcriptional regulator|uniref:Lrp/AsnC family transcriptional regulator n=1 Tax=unclassified Microbacterium TaxID=2609290 RepID=UPI000C5BFDB7|nr:MULTISPECIES: Lrp/AsnC family transcriptional regulator [unclassified Microbacterium]MAY49664.1 AsnC family transcriptional regulator [Microbacterium sp.]HBR89430.1 AsnC family transcriptional regulator [Microbacterium sp.]HBS74785.1 AsnC family transcriptional regulator [Microbacterium sp.]|tara:strand:- start:1452 stop:1955 length:504 start_codon:yes stop_codon:yes gene_type:complete
MPGPQRDMRVRDLAELDAIDKQVIAILSRDGRTTNADLAAALGVAPSTAHTRMRSLVDRGIITGFHASVDHQRLGRGLQAMIGVALRPGARHDSIVAFADEVRKLPQVVQLFFVGGVDDFMVHIAVADASEVREFVVEHLSAQQSVATTRTSIVFEYHRNAVAASFR